MSAHANLKQEEEEAKALKWLYPIPEIFDPLPTENTTLNCVLAAGTFWQAPASKLNAPAYVSTVTGTIVEESRAWHEYPVLQPERNTPQAPNMTEAPALFEWRPLNISPNVHLSRDLVPEDGVSKDFIHLGCRPPILSLPAKDKPVDLEMPEKAANDEAEIKIQPMEKSLKMEKFLAFPLEIRNHIYKHIVVPKGSIRPHLCSSNPYSRPRFHDSGRTYRAVHLSLAISYTSKQVRKEVLEVFYGENTFAWSHDLATYLEYMRYLGRIQMIHQVKLSVDFLNEASVSKTVKQLATVIQMQEDWEKGFIQKAAQIHRARKLPKRQQTYIDPFKQLEESNAWMPEDTINKEAIEQEKARYFKAMTTSDLKRMPMHGAGGLEPFSTMLILRNLSFKNAKNGCTSQGEEDLDREITIRVPAVAMFDEYYSLMWFPKMVASMGIRLRMLDGGDLGLLDRSVQIDWVRKYQRKGVEMEKEKSGPLERNKVMERAERMFEGLKHRGNARPTSYYRRLCNGTIEWFKVE